MKRKTRHKITFDGEMDALCGALAKLGIGNRAIAKKTGLTQCQINYRLNKLKGLESRKNGYRVEWRTGVSEVCQQIQNDLCGVLAADIQRDISPRLIEKQVNGKVK